MSKLIFLKIKTHHGTEYDQLSNWLKNYLSQKYPEDPVKGYHQSAGLVPEYGRVVSASLGYEWNGSIKIATFTGKDEVQILNDLSVILSKIVEMDYVLAGYNINHFDSIYLIKRYIINKIKVPELLKRSLKWIRENKNFDLLDSWRLGENAVSMKLSLNSLGVEPHESYDTTNIKLDDIDFNKLKLECENDIKSMIKLNNYLNDYLW